MPAEFEVDTPNPGAQASATPDAANAQPGGPEPSLAGGMFGNNLWDADDDGPAPTEEPAMHPEQSPKPKPEPEQQARPEPEPEPEPQEAAEPESSDSGDSLEDLEAERAATAERIANLEKRLEDTQKWGNQQSMVNAAAEAVWRAQQYQQKLDQQISAQREAQKFPGFDGEQALTDPEQLASAVERASSWARDTALSAVTPQISQLHAQMQAVLQATPLIEDYARTKARENLTSQGLEAEQADKVLDQAIERINGQEQAASYRINPQALVYASQLVMQEQGAPIKAKPKPAPSAGSGERKAAPPKRKRSPLSNSQEEQLKRVESLLPVKFDDNDRAMLARG